jgi:hypothetical protein
MAAIGHLLTYMDIIAAILVVAALVLLPLLALLEYEVGGAGQECRGSARKDRDWRQQQQQVPCIQLPRPTAQCMLPLCLTQAVLCPHMQQLHTMQQRLCCPTETATASNMTQSLSSPCAHPHQLDGIWPHTPHAYPPHPTHLATCRAAWLWSTACLPRPCPLPPRMQGTPAAPMRRPTGAASGSLQSGAAAQAGARLLTR